MSLKQEGILPAYFLCTKLQFFFGSSLSDFRFAKPPQLCEPIP